MKIKFIITTLTVSFTAFTQPLIPADPDCIQSGIAWNGAASVKIGDSFKIGRVGIGGFVEARNESRFDQGVFPNHNWRGFATASFDILSRSTDAKAAQLMAGIEHESAHPTMGIVESTNNPYEMIYDNGPYRTMSMNSVVVRYAKRWSGEKLSPAAMIDYQFYIRSKNTPELEGREWGETNGLSGGISIGYRLNEKVGLTASIFDRRIFDSWSKASGAMYRENQNGSLMKDSNGVGLKEIRREPIIRGVSTFTVKIGTTFYIEKIDRTAQLYGGFLKGNPFGFVDSREDRSVWEVGLMIGR